MQESLEEIPYDEFRTGLSFRQVYTELKAEQNTLYNQGIYMFITRHTVLGRWRQHKLSMYEHYQNELNKENR